MRTASVALAAIVTCRPTDAAVDAPPPRWFDTTPRVLSWAPAGLADSIASDVGALVADDSLVYVLDRARGDVIAFDVRNGRRRWHWRAPVSVRGTKAADPATADVAAGLSVSNVGAIVAQRDGRALVELDRRGRALRSLPLDRRELLFGICAVARDRVLLSTARAGEPWRLVARSAPSQSVPVPWAGAGRTPAVAWQGALAALPGRAGCAVALSVGPGFAIVDTNISPRPAPYVESVAPALVVDYRVRQGARSGVVHKLGAVTIAATGAAVRGETLFVAFGGATRDRGRLVDRYLWRSGAYAGSIRLPASAARIAVSGDRLFTLGAVGGVSSLRAYDRRPAPP